MHYVMFNKGLTYNVEHETAFYTYRLKSIYSAHNWLISYKLLCTDSKDKKLQVELLKIRFESYLGNLACRHGNGLLFVNCYLRI